MAASAYFLRSAMGIVVVACLHIEAPLAQRKLGAGPEP